MKNTVISYIVLGIVTLLACIEHVIFDIYPVSPASLAMDNAFAVLTGIALFGTIIAHAIDYYKDLKRKRDQNKIKK